MGKKGRLEESLEIRVWGFKSSPFYCSNDVGYQSRDARLCRLGSHSMDGSKGILEVRVPPPHPTCPNIGSSAVGGHDGVPREWGVGCWEVRLGGSGLAPSWVSVQL